MGVGLEGQGSFWDFALGAAVWVGIPLAVLLLGKLAETYLVDIWRRE